MSKVFLNYWEWARTVSKRRCCCCPGFRNPPSAAEQPLLQVRNPLHTLPTVLRPRHKHSQHRRCRNHTYFCILNLRRKFTRKKHTSSHLGVVLQQVRLCVTSLAMEEAGQRASCLKEQWFFYKTKSIHFPQQSWQTPLQTAPSEDFWAQCHNSSWVLWRQGLGGGLKAAASNQSSVTLEQFSLWVNNSRSRTFLTFIMEPSIFKLAKRELLISCTWW